MKRKIMRSLQDSCAKESKDAVFTYLPLGLAPVAQRKAEIEEMEVEWGDKEARLYNPPPDMIGATIAKVRTEEAQKIMISPARKRTP